MVAVAVAAAAAVTIAVVLVVTATIVAIMTLEVAAIVAQDVFVINPYECGVCVTSCTPRKRLDRITARALAHC